MTFIFIVSSSLLLRHGAFNGHLGLSTARLKLFVVGRCSLFESLQFGNEDLKLRLHLRNSSVEILHHVVDSNRRSSGKSPRIFLTLSLLHHLPELGATSFLGVEQSLDLRRKVVNLFLLALALRVKISSSLFLSGLLLRDGVGSLLTAHLLLSL